MTSSTLPLPAATAGHLPAFTTRGLSAQAVLLVAATVVLPAVTHALGLKGWVALPMHWPVLLAGLCYGARAGALLGALAPVTSMLLSGMPGPAMLPAMTAELATYGAVAGLVRGAGFLPRLLAMTAALLAGRMVYLGLAALGGRPIADALQGLTPGAVAAVAQWLVLPALAAWWVGREARRRPTA